MTEKSTPEVAAASAAVPEAQPAAVAPGQGVPPHAEAAPTSAPASSPASESAAAEPKTPEAKPPEPVPSLLAEADAGKREGAPPATEKTETPPTGAPEQPKPEEGKPEAAKPDDGKAKPESTEAAKPEAAAETPPAPLPTYDAFKVPEGAKLDDNKVKEFTTVLGEFESTTKTDHGKVQGLGQRLMDLYHTEMSRVGEQVMQHQRDVWNRLNEKRINELKGDPRLGGNRIDQTLGNAKYALESMLGLSPKQVQKLLVKLDTGGVSNDVTFVRALNNLYDKYREPNPVPSNQPHSQNLPGQRNWYKDVDSGKVA